MAVMQFVESSKLLHGAYLLEAAKCYLRHRPAAQSPQSNYRELVEPSDAVKWSALEPETPANVIGAPIIEQGSVQTLGHLFLLAIRLRKCFGLQFGRRLLIGLPVA